jgi:transcriptional regulator with XRE-family HTH domain
VTTFKKSIRGYNEDQVREVLNAFLSHLLLGRINATDKEVSLAWQKKFYTHLYEVTEGLTTGFNGGPTIPPPTTPEPTKSKEAPKAEAPAKQSRRGLSMDVVKDMIRLDERSSGNEIATRLGISRTAVSSYLKRTRERGIDWEVAQKLSNQELEHRLSLAPDRDAVREYWDRRSARFAPQKKDLDSEEE